MQPHRRASRRPPAGFPAAGGERDRSPARGPRRPAAAAGALLGVVLMACTPGAEDADRGRTATDTTGDRPERAARASTPGGGSADAEGERDGLAYGIRLATDRAVYAPGDTIRMRLEVFRRGGDPITLSFPTAQRHDFVLRGPDASGPGAEVWRWSEGRFFAQATGTVTLGGDRSSITATAAHPAPGSPGLYRIEGWIVASEWPVSAVVPVTVAP